MSAAAAHAVAVDVAEGYRRYVRTLDCKQQARFLRMRGMRRFMARFPDIEEWARRPTAQRLDDLAETSAWQFVLWLFSTGQLRGDVDLLAARRGGGDHYTTWCNLHADDVARAVTIGEQLGWRPAWVDQVCRCALAFAAMTSGSRLGNLDTATFGRLRAELDAADTVSADRRRVLHVRFSSLEQVCFQLGVIDDQRPHPNTRHRSIAEQCAAIPQPAVRDVAVRYLTTCAATLRPATIDDRADSLELFGMWLAEHHPAVEELGQLNRAVIEDFIVWNHDRPSRGRRARGMPVSVVRQYQTLATLKTFFEDLALWGWEQRPERPLLHRSDLPRQPDHVPRALSPLDDEALMGAVAGLEDPAARTAITILRGTGMRLGELLDLELDCLLDYTSHGTWLRVPVGKLNTERTVPIDDTTLAAFDEWVHQRGRSRPLLHPRTRRPVEFLWVVNGRRMGAARIRHGIDRAAASVGIGHVHPHQLRHTYATTLINGGMSLEALMAVLGHVTPEMTLRYAHLASDNIRTAYEHAIAKSRPKIRLVANAAGRFVPDRVEWLHNEMIKTRVAHGYCSRHQTAGACAYSNICEQCDNFTTSHEFTGALTEQLADVVTLRHDADERGWTDDVARHDRVIERLQHHLRSLELATQTRPA